MQGEMKMVFPVILLFFSISPLLAETVSLARYKALREKTMTSASPEERDAYIKYRDYLQKEADKGNLDAQYVLVVPNGNISIEPDRFEQLRNIANKGHAEAMYRVGLVYLYGTKDIPCDQEKARIYLTKSLQKGCAEARTPLAGLLNSSESAEDQKKAILLWEKKLNEDSFSSNMALEVAEAYAKGGLVAKDTAKAVKYWRLAAMDSSADRRQKACERLAECYQKGIGVNCDIDKAIQYYAQADSPRAMRQLEALTDKGNNNARYQLGRYYISQAQKKGVPENAVRGKELVKKAADNGNSEARNYLRQIGG